MTSMPAKDDILPSASHSPDFVSPSGIILPPHRRKIEAISERRGFIGKLDDRKIIERRQFMRSRCVVEINQLLLGPVAKFAIAPFMSEVSAADQSLPVPPGRLLAA